MKIIIKMLTVIGIIATFSVTSSASVADEYIADYEQIVPDGFSDIQSEIKNGGLDVGSLLRDAVDILSGKLPYVATFFMALVGLALLMGSVAFLPEKLRGTVSTSISVIGALYVGASVSGAFYELSLAISEAGKFFSSAIPILSAITLAGGGVKGAAAQAAGMNIVLSVVGGGFGAALSLLSGFSLAMGLASSVGGEGTGAVSKYSRNLFMWIFGIATALIMGMLSLQTLVSASSDSAAMRTAKYMASGYLPMVGGTVSASLSTLAAGLSYAMGVVGASAIIVLLMLFLSPLLLALGYRLALSVASGFAGLIGVASAEKSFSSFRSSFDILIGLYCLSSILYIFEIVLFIKSGVAIL